MNYEQTLLGHNFAGLNRGDFGDGGGACAGEVDGLADFVGEHGPPRAVFINQDDFVF